MSRRYDDTILVILFLVCALIIVMMLSGCGVSRFSASTSASYKTPDGKEIVYESNKEHEGIVVEIKEVDGKAQTIVIKVAQSGTSEAAIAAVLSAQLKLAELLEKLTPLIVKGAMAGS